MAKQTDYQYFTPISPKDILDMIHAALKQSGYETVNNLCVKCGIKQPTMDRILNNLGKPVQKDNEKFATLHTIKLINQALHLDYIVSIPDDVKLKNKQLREWVLDLDRVIDLNMLRHIQKEWFDKDGNPRRDVKGMKAKTPESISLFRSYYYTHITISATKWLEALEKGQEPGRDTRNMSLGYLLKLLSDLGLKLTIRRNNVESKLNHIPTEKCQPKPDDQFLIGRYRSFSQYNLSRYVPYLYYVRKGCDSRGKPYTSDEVLHATPDYILLVPTNKLIATPNNSETIKYTIFKHDGKITTIDNDHLKAYGYVPRSTVKEHQAYGLECVVEGITINVDNLLKYLGKNHHPIIRSLNELIDNHVLELPDQEQSLGMVAQED